jgi:hypothetical protein
MKHKALSFLGRAMLFICIGTVTLWIRSVWRGDVLIYSHPDAQFFRALSVAGFISIQAAPHCPSLHCGLRWHAFPRGSFYWSPPTTRASDGRLWSVTPYSGEQPQIAVWSITFPHGLLAAIVGIPLLIPSALRWRQSYIRRRRTARGCCACCGYDLRASPGRCPECGVAIGRETGMKLTGKHGGGGEVAD